MATARRRGSRRGTATEEREERPTSRRGSRRTSEPEWPEKDTDESPEDEDDAPRGRRGSRRRGGSEDERPRRRSSSAEAPAPSRARGRRGWDAMETQKDVTKSVGTGYVPKETIWKPDEEITLVKFVADEPFVSYAQHWINSKPKGRAGWECISPLPYAGSPDEDFDKYGEVGDCPLCEFLDETPRMQVMFNVIIFNEDTEDWEYRVLRAGVTLSDQLKALNEGRHGPLSKYYWEVMATGTKGSYSPNAQVVKDRDLPEDWELDPLTEDEVDTLIEGAYDESVISFPTSQQLEDLVDEMLG